MWWWTKVHKANIPKEIRASFEMYGEEMVASVLVTRNFQDTDLSKYWPEAMLWLRERRDKKALREDRLETLEWALLILAIMGFVAILPTIVSEAVWLARFLSSIHG
jgi:hypothetical protein